MGLINKTKEQYYSADRRFIGDGVTTDFVLDFDPQPQVEGLIQVYINDVLIADSEYSLTAPTLSFSVAPALDDDILVTLVNKTYDPYRFTKFKDLVNNFMVMYVGPGKILSRVNRREAVLHIRRIIQEFSFDISRVEKVQEIEVGHTASMIMPQDFVEIIEVSWVDLNGIEHPMVESRITSNPSEAIVQDDNFDYIYDGDGDLVTSDPVTVDRFNKQNVADGLTVGAGSGDLFETEGLQSQDLGGRVGGHPELMNANGTYGIDEVNNKITFSSNVVGQLITLKYISDGLGTDEEMRIHKFAEKAVYVTAVLNILESLDEIQEYVINRWRKKSRAEKANAKIRLSRYSPKDLNQLMRNAGKVIK